LGVARLGVGIPKSNAVLYRGSSIQNMTILAASASNVVFNGIPGLIFPWSDVFWRRRDARRRSSNVVSIVNRCSSTLNMASFGGVSTTGVPALWVLTTIVSFVPRLLLHSFAFSQSASVFQRRVQWHPWAHLR
jgi:hypothetical protein